MSKGLEIINLYEESNYLNTFHPNFMKDLQIVKKDLQRLETIDKVLNILKPNLRLVGNCLQARVPLVDEADLWVFVKEITDEEEFDLLKKILEQTQI